MRKRIGNSKSKYPNYVNGMKVYYERPGEVGTGVLTFIGNNFVVVLRDKDYKFKETVIEKHQITGIVNE